MRAMVYEGAIDKREGEQCGWCQRFGMSLSIPNKFYDINLNNINKKQFLGKEIPACLGLMVEASFDIIGVYCI